MKKRILTLTAIMLASAFVLGSCGSDAAEDTTAEETTIADTTAGETTAEETEAPKVEGEIEVLTFEYLEGNQYIETLDQLKDEFETENPDATINFVNFPYGEYENQLRLSLGSGNPSDIVWLDAPFIATYAASGALTALDDYWVAEDFSKLVQSAQQAMTYNGKIYAAPLNEAGINIYYNVDMFETAGIEPPKHLEDQWTWEEYYDVAEQMTVKAADGTVEVYGASPSMGTPSDAGEGVAYSNYAWVWQAGGSVLNEDATQAEGYFNSPETVEALTFYQKLHTEGLAPLQGITNGFPTGKVAMIISGAWEDGYLSINFPDFKYDTTPLPKHKDSATPTGSWNVGIPEGSDNKDAAWAFVEVLVNEEGSQLRCDRSGDVPAIQSVLESSEKFSEDLFIPIKESVLTNGRARPVTPVYPQISEALVSAFSDVAFGEDPQATADKYAAEMQAALDNQ